MRFFIAGFWLHCTESRWPYDTPNNRPFWEAIMVNDVMTIMQNDWVMMALPFFFAALGIELLWAYRAAEGTYEKTDFWASMRVMLLTVFVDLIPKFLGIALMFAAYSVSPLKGVIDASWYWWVLLFFLDDLTYYTFHRANHEVRLLWAGHVSHHNSQYYNLGTALRQGVGERVLKYPFLDAVGLLGLPPGDDRYHVECKLDLPILVAHRSVLQVPKGHRVHFQYALASPSAPWIQCPLPRPQPWRHSHYLGSPIRYLLGRERRRTSGLRADQKHRESQSADGSLR